MRRMYSVLIVDDEGKICRGLAQNVDWKAIGIEYIYTACNAEQALRMVKEHPIDVIITDVKMPGQTGLSMIEKVKQINQKIRFVVISGYAEFAYVQTALHLRVDAYLLKPVNIPELLKTMKCILNIQEDIIYPDSVKVHVLEKGMEAQQYSPLVKRCIRYISENYYKPITLDQIAVFLERNPSYLSHIFRVETGMVITDYITSLRIRKAQGLIHDSSLMLYEIAQMVGYQDYRQFNRAFKKWTGQAPKSVQLNKKMSSNEVNQEEE